MEKIKIFDDMYMFSTYEEKAGLTFNQYLLLGEEPLLVHSGSYKHAGKLIPVLKEILKGNTLAYVFVSHFESDECGGLELIKKNFTGIKPICSQITARQLLGFGYDVELIAKTPGEIFETKDYKLEFISYPSEMHLWEGLLAVETKHKILFSSDLLIRRGLVKNYVVDAKWEEEIEGIANDQIPCQSALETMKRNLLNLSVNYGAPGHGPVLKV